MGQGTVTSNAELVNLRSIVNGKVVEDAAWTKPIVQSESKVSKGTMLDLTSP